MSDLTKAAKIAFSSEYSFFIKAQNFHWNVEGPLFQQFHALFGGVYEEVYGSLDAFAEQIRALGSYAPASHSRLSMLSQIDDENDVLDANSMVKELLSDNEKIVKTLKMVFQLSEQANEYGFSDFIAGRIDAHQKHGWMLRSTLK